MTDLQMFNNPEFGTLRGIEIEGEAWFVGNDVARALGYAKPRNAINTHVDPDDALKWGIIDTLGREQQTTVINETGVLTLILMSELPSAKKFRRWVTKEVLPSILRTGSYSLPQLSQNELILQMAQANVELEKRMIAIEDNQQKFEQRLDTAIKVFSAPNIDHWKADMDNTINRMVDEYKRSSSGFRGMLYKELEDTANVQISARLSRMRNRLKQQGVTYKERIAISKLDVISKDKQLRLIFESIVKKYQATYSAVE